MSSAGEFDGDEFSNNLFSDLAPLLTLFGEQVTIQFLSMSLGWADNFLLAMGPLGIITIVISAIRIGGGRRLKSLVGRARETQSVAEQELLSSTSANVCEAWNGQQITRLIGEAQETTTIVIANNGEAYSLPQAFREGLITTDEDNTTNNTDGEFGPKTFEETLRFNAHMDATYLDLPANLSLNARAPPAPPRELCLWASVGFVLQTIALVFPGISTYLLDWKKGGDPIDAYGYPCFVVGTISMTIGVMLCGHIIEGATQETNFIFTKKAENRGLRILCLQKAVTIGDQHFPSCAIFLAERDRILRTSRRGYLKHGHVWSRATASTFITLSGYIVQFVGLRALHWSATIVQLGVTLIMTGIRAWARRNFASDPTTSDLGLQGHDVAWLTMLLRFEADKRALKAPKLFEEGQYFWEIISDHSGESGVKVDWPQTQRLSASSWTYVRDRTGLVCSQLLQRVRGPLVSSLVLLEESSGQSATPESPNVADSVRTYAGILSRIHLPKTGSEDNDTVKASTTLCRVLCEMMRSRNLFGWFDWDEKTHQALENSPEICWEFNVRGGPVLEFDQKASTQDKCRIGLRKDCPFTSSSTVVAQLEAAISLSLYTDAARMMHATGQAEPGAQTTQRYIDRRFRRIVGYITEGKIELDQHRYQLQLRYWLGCKIFKSNIPSMRKEELNLQMKTLVQRPDRAAARQLSGRENDTGPLMQMIRQGVSESYLGMFLSSSADYSEESVQDKFEQLLIEEPPQTTKAFLYAKELFSLFILAMAPRVKSIKGEFINGDQRIRARRSIEHSVFNSIAEIAVENKLVQSIDEAYELIVPAFAKYKLLP